MTHQLLPAVGLGDVRDDERLKALANERRRLALDCLPCGEAPTALADVARRIAVSEAEAPVDAVATDHVERVKRSLYHVHLPKLDDVGLVAFDPEERTVERAATDAVTR